MFFCLCCQTMERVWNNDWDTAHWDDRLSSNHFQDAALLLKSRFYNHDVAPQTHQNTKQSITIRDKKSLLWLRLRWAVKWKFGAHFCQLACSQHRDDILFVSMCCCTILTTLWEKCKWLSKKVQKRHYRGKIQTLLPKQHLKFSPNISSKSLTLSIVSNEIR